MFLMYLFGGNGESKIINENKKLIGSKIEIGVAGYFYLFIS